MTYRPNNNLSPGNPAGASSQVTSSQSASSTTASTSATPTQPASPFVGASATNAQDWPQTGRVRAHRLSRSEYMSLAALSKLSDEEDAPSTSTSPLSSAATTSSSASCILNVSERRQLFERIAAQRVSPSPVPAPLSLPAFVAGRDSVVSALTSPPSASLPPSAPQPAASQQVVASHYEPEDDPFDFGAHASLWDFSPPVVSAPSAVTPPDDAADEDDFEMPEIIVPVTGIHAMSGIGIPIRPPVRSALPSYYDPATPLPVPTVPLVSDLRTLNQPARVAPRASAVHRGHSHVRAVSPSYYDPATPLPVPTVPRDPNVVMLSPNVRLTVVGPHRPSSWQPPLPRGGEPQLTRADYGFRQTRLVSGAQPAASAQRRSSSPVKYPPKPPAQDGDDQQ